MPSIPRRVLALAAGALTLFAPAAVAQEAAGSSVASVLPTLGGYADEALRIDQALGHEPVTGFLIRSPSSRARATADSPASWTLLAPGLRGAWNSDLPFSGNDGPLWAGRGLSVQALAGFRAHRGRVTLIVAPQVAYQQNLAFQRIADTTTARSPFGDPWILPSGRYDVPTRFGDEPFTTVDPGQSSLAVALGPVEVGGATENQWWGPAARNALVMSANAAGIPHLFLRTAAPLPTRAGQVEAKWIVGALSESAYFDESDANDLRSISGLALVLYPRIEPNLGLGLSRTVYRSVGSPAGVPLRALDVLTRAWRGSDPAAAEPADSVEQVTSLFFRWVVPAAGLEAYGEWAREEMPFSLRDLLTSPGHSRAFTLGTRWARPLAGSTLLLHAEISQLEHTGSFLQRPESSYYRSVTVPQGYSQRGQLVGASIGPGSTQWIGVDHHARRWSLGASAGRIRWDNDAYYTNRTPRLHQIGFVQHDVSTLLGVRARVRAAKFDLAVEYLAAKRRNYLFQNRSIGFEPTDAVDVRNHTLSFEVTPFAPRQAQPARTADASR